MKKIIDEHGRVFGKVSIIDFFVILIVIVIAAALYVKFNVLDATNKTAASDTVAYTVTIYGVRGYTADAIKTGDILFDKNGGANPVGTVTDIQKVNAKKASEKADGTIVMGDYMGRYDVTLTITANGAKNDGRFLVNKIYELNVNSVRTFNTKFCTFEATITEIK